MGAVAVDRVACNYVHRPEDHFSKMLHIIVPLMQVQT
jgi:hypothetical protein